MQRSLADTDPDIATAIRNEVRRQAEGLELIASENFVSEAVLQAAGSVMTNKYAEGYPGKRYYGGCEFVDVAESLAIARAKQLFGADHANVQPHSGAQANAAVFLAFLKPGDTFLGMDLSQGMDRLLPAITLIVVDLLHPKGVLARNDPKVRALEGLPQSVDVLHGEIPDSIVVREGPVEYDVDLRKGQKTGLFLDQRENREAAARYARGRLLDCFSYNGGFALRLARTCPEAEALDISADAVDRIRANAVRNGVPHLQAREVNVFDELRRLERAGARYDTIVLDPPAFAKNKASIPNAIAGYKEINLRAMRLLNPGGYLITCSCSYNVNEEMFAEVIHAASIDSHTPVTFVEKRMQGRDHPVLVGVPETYYLKCFILRRVE